MVAIAPAQDRAIARALRNDQAIVVGQLIERTGEHQATATAWPSPLCFHRRQPTFEPADVVHDIGESAAKRCERRAHARLGRGGGRTDLNTSARGTSAATLGNGISGPARGDTWLHAGLLVVSSEALTSRDLFRPEQCLAPSVAARGQLLQD